MGLPRETIEAHEREYTAVQLATTSLLDLLREHHDFSVIRPAERKPRKPAIRPPPKERYWFKIDDEPLPPSVDDVKRAVCKYFEVSHFELVSERKTWNVAYPRQIAMYLSSLLTKKSYPKIGRALGGRDHTTVMHGAKKIKKDIFADITVAYDVAHVEALVS